MEMKLDAERVKALLERELMKLELELTDIGYFHVHDGVGFVGAPNDITPEQGDLNVMGDFDGMQETNKALAVELIQQVQALQRALIRVSEGTYGICVTCGKEIEKERLAAYLGATTCIECA